MPAYHAGLMQATSPIVLLNKVVVREDAVQIILCTENSECDVRNVEIGKRGCQYIATLSKGSQHVLLRKFGKCGDSPTGVSQ